MYTWKPFTSPARASARALCENLPCNSSPRNSSRRLIKPITKNPCSPNLNPKEKENGKTSSLTMVLEVLLVEQRKSLKPLGKRLLRDDQIVLPTSGTKAATNALEVGQVGNDIQEDGTAIARKVNGSGADRNLIRTPDAVIAGVASNPVLRGRVTEAEEGRREARDRVGAVGDAEVAAGLGGEVVYEDGVADAGGAVGVDVDRAG